MIKTLVSLTIFLLTISSCATNEKAKKFEPSWKFKDGSACLELEDVKKLREELVRCQH